MDQITKKLLKHINLGTNEKQKSSHWLKYTQNFNFKNGEIAGISGFSYATKKFPFLDIYHRFLQKLNYSNVDFSFNSYWYKVALSAMNKQSRIVDSCVLRQVLTMNLLDKKLNLEYLDNICVIGDGQSNFVAIALESNKFKKILSINLPEVLLNDFILIKKMGFPTKKINLINTKKQLRDFYKNDVSSFGMIEANNVDILYKEPIDLFVNIASFGEMTLDTVSNYFKIIKSTLNGAYLYSCNREEKRLPDGTIIKLKDFPWEGFTQKILDEGSPWNINYYRLRRGLIPIPKVKIPLDGAVNHKILFYPPFK